MERSEHHFWCNFHGSPVEGCELCKRLWEEYPYGLEKETDLYKKYFPHAIIRPRVMEKENGAPSLKELARLWDRAGESDPMTGEDKDAVLAFMQALSGMTPGRRAQAFSCLFDGVCISCGVEMDNKWGSCLTCGCPRVEEIE